MLRSTTNKKTQFSNNSNTKIHTPFFCSTCSQSQFWPPLIFSLHLHLHLSFLFGKIHYSKYTYSINLLIAFYVIVCFYFFSIFIIFISNLFRKFIVLCHKMFWVCIVHSIDQSRPVIQFEQYVLNKHFRLN